MLEHNSFLQSVTKLSGYSKLVKLVDFKFEKLVLNESKRSVVQ